VTPVAAQLCRRATASLRADALGALALLTAIGAVLLLGACRRHPPRGLPFGQSPSLVLLLSLDTLRADRLGTYGYFRDTSPRLDQFARQATVFETVGAQATQTLVSHKSLLAGKYPLRLVHEATGADLSALSRVEDPTAFLVSTFSRPRSPSLVALLAEELHTAAFVDGGWIRERFGFADGFQIFDEAGGNLERILPRVYAYLRQPVDRRRFVFVHAYDVHCPYPCRAPYNEQFCSLHSRHVPLEGRCGKGDLAVEGLSAIDLAAVTDHYDGGIASADAWIGELFDRLRASGLWEESLVIVTSDHGESLGEHGEIGHGGLYLEQLLVPLVIKFPASWAVPAARIRDPVELVDVLPTVLEAVGLRPPPDLDGRSLLPLVRGQSGGRRVLVAQTTFRDGPQLASRLTKRALLVPSRWLLVDDDASASFELYELRANGREGALAISPDARLVARLSSLLARFDPRGEHSAPPTSAAPPIDEETASQLRALGYL
jgi:hypothetical protein